MREGELVREVEDQSTVNYEREIGELVREVEDQSAVTYEKEVGNKARRYLCWICGDRPFNARHQLVDHIEGAGGGGKSHLKMRKRWIENGQPMREDWLATLEQKNAADNGDPHEQADDNGDPEKQAEIILEVSSAKMDNDVETSLQVDDASSLRPIWNVPFVTQNGAMYSPEWPAPPQWEQHPPPWFVPLSDYRDVPSWSESWQDDVRNASQSGKFEVMSSGCDGVVQPDPDADRSMGFWDHGSPWQYQ